MIRNTPLSTHSEYNNSLKYYILIVCVTIGIIALLSVMKFRSGEINYLNSDATWHELLTIKAYDETPVSQHKFLPLVSLGRTVDKNIPWGATIPDAQGNYYYTSFSPASYVLGYFFIKTFNLGYTEKSLYMLNSILFALSGVILAFLLSDLFRKSWHRTSVVVTGVLIYAFQPELMHGMGIVYWAQSLMQVALIAQIYAYYRWREYSSSNALIAFIFFSVANPYIEWTGYVADFGFALAELIFRWKENRFKAIVCSEAIMLLPVVSFVLFCLHYCSTVEPSLFFNALKARFLARNFSTPVPTKFLLTGYWQSFQATWIFLSILLLMAFSLWFLQRKRRIAIFKRLPAHWYILLFVSVIPMIENFVMKEHAISYSFDRMKLVYPIVLISCICVDVILNAPYKKIHGLIGGSVGLCAAALVVGLLNFHSYIKDPAFIWPVDYRQDNEKLVEMLSDYRNDSVFGVATSVRGYLNMLLNSGCFEGVDLSRLMQLSSEKRKRYPIELEVTGGAWNMYNLHGATVYDNLKGEGYYVVIAKDGHSFIKTAGYGYPVSSLTDPNWENGVSRQNNIVLLSRNDRMLEQLKSAKKLVSGAAKASILHYESDALWIRITLDMRPQKEFAYPAFVRLE